MSAETISAQKQLVRTFMRHQLRQLSSAERNSQSNKIIQKIEQCEEFRAAHSVLCYWPIAEEVNLIPLIEKYALEKNILLPVVSGTELELRCYENASLMQSGAFGIPEPTGNIYRGEIDLVLVPGVAFDDSGCRLGRGKGYYDRFLKQRKLYTIGIAYKMQVLSQIPMDEWDVCMDMMIVSS